MAGKQHQQQSPEPKKARGEAPRSTNLRPAQEIPKVDIPHVNEAIESSSKPLDESVRRPLEKGFNHDFSEIQVHTNTRAVESADALKARAFSVGQHVILGRGEYSPKTAKGWRLLAHEVVHSLQRIPSRLKGSFESSIKSDDSSPAEREAGHLSRRANQEREHAAKHPEPLRVAAPAGAVLQRQGGGASAFKLETSKVGAALRAQLNQRIDPGSEPPMPRVKSDHVLKILASSSSFVQVAEQVETKYFPQKGSAAMTVNIHEDKDIGSHFIHDKGQMEVFMPPNATALPEVVQGIVHEIVHAGRGRPKSLGGKKKYGSITRVERGGIKDEAKTRELENKIMKEIMGASPWNTYAKGVTPSTKATKTSDVRSDFISGKPRLTYQEHFVVEAAEDLYGAGLSQTIRSKAEQAAAEMIQTGEVDRVSKENKESFKFGKETIKHHEDIVARGKLSATGAKGTMLRQSWEQRQIDIVKLSKTFLDLQSEIQKIKDKTRRKDAFRYFRIALVKKKMAAEWEASKGAADAVMRKDHLAVLKALIGKKLKGISKPK